MEAIAYQGRTGAVLQRRAEGAAEAGGFGFAEVRRVFEIGGRQTVWMSVAAGFGDCWIACGDV